MQSITVADRRILVNQFEFIDGSPVLQALGWGYVPLGADRRIGERFGFPTLADAQRAALDDYRAAYAPLS